MVYVGQRLTSYRLTNYALKAYLDPPAAVDPRQSKEARANQAFQVSLEASQGDKLFYKLANLDDRIKNADQVS